MPLVNPSAQVQLCLRKDLVRSVKRGHAWLFSDAIELPRAPAGSVATVWDRKQERKIASGIYDAEHAIPLRICRTTEPLELDDHWLERQLRSAYQLRQQFFDDQTTGYRLVAGEGDCIPGMIIDVYGSVAVMKLDGGAPEAFYNAQGITAWLLKHSKITGVVLRSRTRGRPGEVIAGDVPTNPVPFLEHGLRFTADVLKGQKTGFFLDQRDNRQLIRQASRDCHVLNLFSFSGGFSIAAGIGGAKQVTSVDMAGPAIDTAHRHWLDNGLNPSGHSGISQDCFKYLEGATSAGDQWDIVICDPPSFAPSEKAREKAILAYRRLAQLSARVTRRGGLLALASCSSHISRDDFSQLNQEALGAVRRLPTFITERGLPPDHVTPAAMPELRYLKFQLYRLD